MILSSLVLAVAVGFSQPFDGKRTVVIERADGSRVRNLVGGVPAKAGEGVEWDGLDDDGKVVPPGDYRWRALAHPGLTVTNFFEFCNGYGSNHGTLVASATDDSLLFFATSVSEGGHDVVALNPDGSFYGGWNAPYGHGLADVRLAAKDGFVYAKFSGKKGGRDSKDEGDSQVLKIDVKAKKVVAFDKTAKIGEGLAFNTNVFVDPKTGKRYVAEEEQHLVRILGPDGQELKTLGVLPGGHVAGPYVPERLERPSSVVVGPDGLVWVTERYRFLPKRLVAFDEASGKVVKSYFGPARYGAPGAGIDPEDPTHWLALGAQFKLDFAKGTAVPTHVLGGFEGRRFVIHREAGRTFAITWADHAITFVQEILADGSLKPMAAVASAHCFAYYCGWKPPEAFVRAFNARTQGDVRTYGTAEKPLHGLGFFWTDANGNGAMDADEYQFTDKSWKWLAGNGWGPGFNDLVFRFPAVKADGTKCLVTMKPDGFRANGVPNYPTLDAALAKAVAVDAPYVKSWLESSCVDRRGNYISSTSPHMVSVAPDGTVNWRYPNRWVNVHGSHDAPLPKLGELQGVLFFSGCVPLDGECDVMALTGNHGREFFIDSTGLYIDELFRDVRTFSGNSPYTIGGEAFGGTFEKCADGKYYLQVGGMTYKVYRVDGFDKIVRSSGTVRFTREDAAKAEAAAAARTVDPGVVKEATVGPFAKDFAGAEEIAWEADRFHPVKIRLATDAGLLRFRFDVRDPSPWVNNGTDAQALFKTGDACQIELESAEGPVRLLVAPMGQETKVVRYREKVKGGKQADFVLFQSPWRAVQFDSVTVLASAEAKVTKRPGNGYVLEGSVPLADLGFGAKLPRRTKGDVGVIYGNVEGTADEFRNCWANKATGLVNDVPGEVMFAPKMWGTFVFAAGGSGAAEQLVSAGTLGYNPPPADLKAQFPDADLTKNIRGWYPVWEAGGMKWGWGYHGTIYRYEGTNTSGAVALGGGSGHFIGHLDENPDCVEIRGIVAGQKPNEFFCRGRNGVFSRLRWDPAMSRLFIEERLGDVANLDCLGIDARGRVLAGKGNWEWNDAPGAPLRHGSPGAPLGSCMTMDGVRFVAFAPHRSEVGVFSSTLDEDPRVFSFKEKMDRWMYKWHPRAVRPAGSVPYTFDRKRLILLVGAKGEARLIRLNGERPVETSAVTLDWGGTPTNVTSVALDSPREPKRLFAAADGRLVAFALQADGTWRRTGAHGFGGEIHVACDGTYLWISEAAANRVVAYRFGQMPKPAFSYVGTGDGALHNPGLIAAANGRVVVHDRGVGRLVKLELR